MVGKMTNSTISASNNALHFLNLPTELQDKIINYMSFEEIAHLRLVCKSFDKMCQSSLNNGFKGVDRFHGKCLRKVKAQLPRRESERRNHHLARHCDILNAIETRLSLLNMTFIKYVELRLCCFIPGKVIDEIYRVLQLIQRTSSPPRAHEILQELRDISSMAMEHFDDKIVPILKQKMLTSPGTNLSSPSSTCSYQGYVGLSRDDSSDGQNPTGTIIHNELVQLQQACKHSASLLKTFRKELNACKSKILEHERKILKQEKTIMELNHTIADQNVKISEQEGRVNEVGRKLNEVDVKLPPPLIELVNGKERLSLESVSRRISEDLKQPLDAPYRKRLRSFGKITYKAEQADDSPKRKRSRSKRNRIVS